MTEQSLAETIACCRRTLSLHPEDAQTRVRLADALKRTGEREAAIAEYREAVRLDPANALAHVALGHALWGQNDFGGAIAEYREAVRLEPQSGAWHSYLAITLMDEDDPGTGRVRPAAHLDEAIAEYRKAIHLGCNEANVYGGLGDALKEKGNLEEAIAAYKQATEGEPKSELWWEDLEDAHFDLGASLEKRGDLQGATAEYREWARLSASSGRHWLVGWFLAKRGDLDGAIAEFRETLRLAPVERRGRFSIARRSLYVALLRKAVKTPLGTLLSQYFLLFLGVAVLAWSLGFKILRRPAVYLPRLAAAPVALMLFAYCYRRFLGRPK